MTARERRCLLPALLLFQLQDAAHTLVDALLGEDTVLHGLDHGIEGFHEVLGAEDDVGTGLERAHGSLGIGVLLIDGDGSGDHSKERIIIGITCIYGEKEYFC